MIDSKVLMKITEDTKFASLLYLWHRIIDITAEGIAA